ncbi:MAG TPA: hypothetical protein V6C52_11055 [Coleofasciculaceae cyanobacterium]|jgi:hypothetical protein
MDFTQALKVFELNILRQSGIMVTPQQLGLKTDPIADLQAKNAQSSFDGILGKMMGGTTALTPPTPPTPPADPNDAAAQAKYQQDVLAYQQSSQLYNQRLMQMMLQQLQGIQQAIAAGQKAQSNSASTSSSDIPLGIGGILEGNS